jgi:hypothetical protein
MTELQDWCLLANAVAVTALRRKLFTHSDMDVAKRNTTPRKGETK